MQMHSQRTFDTLTSAYMKNIPLIKIKQIFSQGHINPFALKEEYLFIFRYV